MVISRKFRIALVSAAFTLTTGCASYYSHYGSFSAENSSGKLRQYLVSWQTAEYPDWWLQDDKSTALTLKTQCSEREIRFHDTSTGGADAGCISDRHGIAWCADPSLDQPEASVAGQPSMELCGWIHADSAASIVEIGNNLQVYIQCRPLQVEMGSGDDRKNYDYLKASSVPYTVAVKKVRRGSWDDRPPVLDSKACTLDVED